MTHDDCIELARRSDLYTTRHTNPITECAPCRERDRKLKEEPMPDLNPPTVTVATIAEVSNVFQCLQEPNVHNGVVTSHHVSLDWPAGVTRPPEKGDTVVVSSSTEGIFAWISEQTKAREDVLAAAIAWAETYGPPPDPRFPVADMLYDAVQRAKGVTPGGTFADTDRFPDKEQARRVMEEALGQVMADAPSEAADPGVDLARRVAEAVGGDREVTVIIVGEI